MREKEHWADFKNLVIKSHMLKHKIIYDKEFKSVTYKMEILECPDEKYLNPRKCPVSFVRLYIFSGLDTLHLDILSGW